MSQKYELTIVVIALLAWIGVATLLTRNAQRAVMPRLPAAWPSIAIASIVAGAAVYLHPLPAAARCGAACIALIIAGAADASTGYLFDAVTLPSACVVLAISLCSGDVISALLGMGLLVLCFGCIVALSRGRSMGFGDVKAMATMGAAFGPAESCLAVAAACMSGVIEALIRGRLTRRAEIRFGPHLAAGATFALVCGDPIVRSMAGR